MDDSLKRKIEDTLIGHAPSFTLGERGFRLYPTTIGKSILIRRRIAELHLDPALLAADPVLELMRGARSHPDTVAEIVAIATSRDKRQLDDTSGMEERVSFIRENLECDDAAGLLLSIMTADNSEEIVRGLGLDMEQKKRAEIAKMKKGSGGTVTFGGKSAYGLLINRGCELFHCTPEHLVWEVSLVSLRLAVADSVECVYLSDEECAKMCVFSDDTARVESMSEEELRNLTAG